jgi:hypothetical protein
MNDQNDHNQGNLPLRRSENSGVEGFNLRVFLLDSELVSLVETSYEQVLCYKKFDILITVDVFENGKKVSGFDFYATVTEFDLKDEEMLAQKIIDQFKDTRSERFHNNFPDIRNGPWHNSIVIKDSASILEIFKGKPGMLMPMLLPDKRRRE